MNSTDDLPSFIPPMCLLAKYLLRVQFNILSSFFQWVCSCSPTIHLVYMQKTIVYTQQSRIGLHQQCNIGSMEKKPAKKNMKHRGIAITCPDNWRECENQSQLTVKAGANICA